MYELNVALGLRAGLASVCWGRISSTRTTHYLRVPPSRAIRSSLQVPWVVEVAVGLKARKTPSNKYRPWICPGTLHVWQDPESRNCRRPPLFVLPLGWSFTLCEFAVQDLIYAAWLVPLVHAPSTCMSTCTRRCKPNEESLEKDVLVTIFTPSKEQALFVVCVLRDSSHQTRPVRRRRRRRRQQITT